MRKENLLTLAAIVAAFVLGAMLFRSCGSTPETTNRKTIDSLVSVTKEQNKAFKAYQDSADKALDRRDALIVSLQVAKDEAYDAAHKSKERAVYWSNMYKQAREIRDTDGQLTACDSLQREFDSYVVRVDAYIVGSDSVINAQHEQIQSMQEVINRQREQLNTKDQAFELVVKSNLSLLGENKDLKKDVTKAKRWGNRKGIFAAILGGVIGFAAGR